MIKSILKLYLVANVLTISIITTCSAEEDEIIEYINEGLEQYKQGEYTSAAGNLDYAAQMIRQKKGDKLQDCLPEPLSGWSAEESTSQSAGAAMFGGGVTAERKYTNESKSITISIVTDSPMLQSIIMMFSNPMIMASGGGKLQKIAGQKAIVKYTESNQNGEITIVAANRFLITIKGNRVTKEDLVNYASAVDYKKIVALP